MADSSSIVRVMSNVSRPRSHEVDESQTTLMRIFHIVRSQVVLVLVVALGLAAGGAITLYQLHADASRRAQSKIQSVKFALADLQAAPFNADPHSGGSPAYARAAITSDTAFISHDVRELITAGFPPAPLLRVQAAVRGAGPAIHQIFEIGAYRGGYGGRERRVVYREQRDLQTRVQSTLALLTQAEEIYSQRASTASTESVFGSLGTVLLLLTIFALFYRRATFARAAAERLSTENIRLLEASRDEAITDPLTSLGNRRAFKPVGSRIIAVCDAYDAMVAPRPYRAPSSMEHALSELHACAGSQFDPDVVNAFASLPLTGSCSGSNSWLAEVRGPIWSAHNERAGS